MLLHLDTALIEQTGLCERALELGARVLDARDLGPALRLWSRPAALDALRERLRALAPEASAPELVFAGSGDFHHVAFLLIERALAGRREPATVLHFDNHPDWVKFRNGMHCGSWVAHAARLRGVARVVTIGVCSSDIHNPRRKGADLSLLEDERLELYPYRAPKGGDSVSLCGRAWPTIEAIGESRFADFLIPRIATRDVYVTIDKDVLRAEDAITNWDQGRVSLKLVKELLERLAGERRVIGADVVGDWSAASYGGGLVSSVLKRGEALIDQPWRQPSPGRARARNEAVNLELLALLEGVRA